MELVTDPAQPLLFPGGCVCGDSLSRPMLDTKLTDVVDKRIYLCAIHVRELLAAVEHAPLQDLVDAVAKTGAVQAELEQARNELRLTQEALEVSERDYGFARAKVDELGAVNRILEEKLREANRPPEVVSREQFLRELETAETTKGA